MKLSFNKNGLPNNHPITYLSDGSFGNQRSDGDFRMSFANSTLLLNFLKRTRECTSCEGYFPFNLKGVNSFHISLDHSIDGSLVVDFDHDERNSYGAFSDINLMERYQDIENQRIGYGNMTAGQLVRFGLGQYARIEKEKIVGIIICFK